MSGRRACPLIVAFAAACLSACEPPTDPLPPAVTRILVHGLLDAAADTQWIKLQEMGGSDFFPERHITDATVTITAPDGTIFGTTDVNNCAEEFMFCDGVYRTTALGAGPGATPIVPGGTYTLNIQVPGGAVVTGSTTVPNFAGPMFRDTIPFFSRNNDTLRLRWPRVPLARRYEVVIRNVLPNPEFNFFDDYRVFTDTSVTIAGNARTIDNDFIFFSQTGARVLVTAVDDNYYAFYHTNADPFAGAPPSRLTGAIGFFGSIVPVRYRVYGEVLQ